MHVRYPIPTTANERREAALLELLNKIRVEPTGHYLLSEGGSWHGGIHITEKSHPNHAFEPVGALADGELVAYRITEDYLQSTFQDKTLHYSNSFCLLRHQCPMPDSENSFTFYSLYMHLRPLSYQPGPLYRVKKNRNTRSVANPADHSGNPDALPAGSLIECLTEPAEQHPLGESEYLFIKARTYNPDNGDVSDPFWIALHEKNKPAFYTEGFEAQDTVPRWYPQSRITPPKGDDLERFQLTSGRNIRWAAPPYASTAADATLPAGTELLLLNDSGVTAQLGQDQTQYTFKRYRILTGGHENKEGWMAFDKRYFQQMATSTIPLPAAEEQPEIRSNQLVILDTPIPIRAGDALGYLGLHERLCREGDGSTEHCHQIHLETFAVEPPPQALFNTEHWRWMKDGEITDHQGNPEEDNTFFKDLLTSLDENDDQHLSYEEVQRAYQNEGIATPLEHMISLHTNEWHDDANRSRYKKWEIYLGQVRAWIKGQDERKAFYDRLQDNLKHEKERLAQLKWLDAVQGRLGLTKDVWHLHPIRLVNQLQKHTREDVLALLRQNLIRFEGAVEHMYRDSLGHVTVGVGHLISSVEHAADVAFLTSSGEQATRDQIIAEYNRLRSVPETSDGTLPPEVPDEAFFSNYTANWYKARGHVSLWINDGEIERLLNEHIVKFTDDLRDGYLNPHALAERGPMNFDSLPDSVKLAAYDLIFNVGKSGFFGNDRFSGDERNARGFHDFNIHISNLDWEAAAGEARRSQVSDARNKYVHELLLSAARGD